MHPTGIKLNDGKIYAKGKDGKEAEVVIVDDFIGTAEIEPMEDKFTYGNAVILKGDTVTLSLPLTHKEWFKKRKGKRWVWYYEVKPGWSSAVLDIMMPYGRTKSKFGFSKKKRRGKRAKEFMRYIGFCREWMKNNYIDYSAYTKDCEEVEMMYPGDDTVYKYKVLKPEDNAKFEAIVTKRIDEIKERKEK